MRLVGMLRGALLALALVGAVPAQALQITLSGPTVGPLTGGVGVEEPAVASAITFTVGLDSVVAIQGYDVTIAWDAGELAFLSASELSGIGFTLAPDGATPGGERIAAIAFPSLPAVGTALLFSVTFGVTAVVADGAIDFRVFIDPPSNGGGIAPGGLGPIANPSGAAIAVPEPALAGLLLVASGALASRRSPLFRRRRLS